MPSSATVEALSLHASVRRFTALCINCRQLLKRAGTILKWQLLQKAVSADLVSRAKVITPSLSQTVETLLEAWVIGEEARQSDHAAQIAQWVAVSNAVLEQGGSPDEWSRF